MASLGVVNVDINKEVREGRLTVRVHCRGLWRLRARLLAVKCLLWAVRIVAPCNVVIRGPAENQGE